MIPRASERLSGSSHRWIAAASGMASTWAAAGPGPGSSLKGGRREGVKSLVPFTLSPAHLCLSSHSSELTRCSPRAIIRTPRQQDARMHELNTQSLLSLYSQVAALKLLPRTGWLQRGVSGAESVAEHIFGVAVLALLVGDS